MQINFEVPGVPVAWTVYTKRGPPPPQFTHMKEYQERIYRAALQQIGHRKEFPLTGPISLTITFIMPYPKGIPKRPQNRLKWLQSHYPKSPDLTNLLKACEDALHKKVGIIQDDSQTVTASVSKAYGEIPTTIIQIEETSK